MTVKSIAPRNRTLRLQDNEVARLSSKLIKLDKHVKSVSEIENKTICQDTFVAIDYLPSKFVDLLFIDPPYNLDKAFNEITFKSMNDDDYQTWLDSWLGKLVRIMKPNGSIYICGDWKSSGAIYNIAKKYFIVRNRITWEREKGRGAKNNWKNCSEDIWFCTMSNEYYFDVDSVKMKRKVIAPYRSSSGDAKDWSQESGGKYRITHPSNLWTDITIPFWSMPENTDHPTQKPEKLAAKILLASSKPGDLVFDPFVGSGTTSVVAKKLGRKYVGIEYDNYYCALTEKRLELVDQNNSIQGYSAGVFWERNSLSEQPSKVKDLKNLSNNFEQENLFINPN